MEAKLPRYYITNNARGPRMILTPGGGKTVRPGETETVTLTDNEMKAVQPYISNGDLSIREVPEGEEEESAGTQVSMNATPSSDGAKLDNASDTVPAAAGASTEGDSSDVVDDENGPDVTHVEHKGFGRWYGMKGDERVTEAMTRAEAEAFAEEHKVPMGNEPDPEENSAAGADDETPPTETSPPDNQETE